MGPRPSPTTGDLLILRSTSRFFVYNIHGYMVRSRHKQRGPTMTMSRVALDGTQMQTGTGPSGWPMRRCNSCCRSIMMS